MHEMNEMSLGKEENDKEKTKKKYRSKRSLRNNFSTTTEETNTTTKTKTGEEGKEKQELAFVFGVQEKHQLKQKEGNERAGSAWTAGFSGGKTGGGFVASAAAVAAAAFQMPANFLFTSSSNASTVTTPATTMTREAAAEKSIPESRPTTTTTTHSPPTAEFGGVHETRQHARPSAAADVQFAMGGGGGGGGGETSSETSRMDVDDDIVTRTEDLHIGEEVTSVARPAPMHNVIGEKTSTSKRETIATTNNNNNGGSSSAARFSFSFGAQQEKTVAASNGMGPAPMPFNSGADAFFARPSNGETQVAKDANDATRFDATRHRGASTHIADDGTGRDGSTQRDVSMTFDAPRTADGAGTSAPNTIRFNFEASSKIDNAKPTQNIRSGRVNRRRDVASVIRQTAAMKIDSNGFGSIASPGQPPPHVFTQQQTTTTTAPASRENVDNVTGTADAHATTPPFQFSSPPNGASPSPPKPRPRSASGRARGRKYSDGLFSGVNAGGSGSFQWGGGSETFDNVDIGSTRATTSVHNAGRRSTFTAGAMSNSSDDGVEGDVGVDGMNGDNRRENYRMTDERNTPDDARTAADANERVDIGDSGAFADDEGRGETRRFVRARSFARGKASASPPTSSERMRSNSMPASANGGRETVASSSSLSLNKVYADLLKARMLLQQEKLEEASTAFSEILLSLSAASGGGHESHYIQNVRSQCSDGLQSISKLTRARKLIEQQQRQQKAKEAAGRGYASGSNAAGAAGSVQQQQQQEQEDEHYAKAMLHKNAGNDAYKQKEYERAESEYSAGIAALLERLGIEEAANVGNATIPSSVAAAAATRRGQNAASGESSMLAVMKKLLAILYSNRSACYCHTNAYCRAISDCYSCILHDKHYVKGLWRRVLLFQAIGCEQDQATTDVQSIVSILKKRLRLESIARAGGRTPPGGTGADASGSSIPEMKQEIAKAERLLSTLRNQTWSVCHYKVLGLKQFEDDSKKIKTAYRQLALVYHPDKMSQQDQEEVSTSLFKMINEAHNVLSSRKDKLEYDKERRRQQYAPRDAHRDYHRNSSGNYNHHRTYYDYSDDSSFDYDSTYGYGYGSGARYAYERYRQSSRATSSSTAQSSGRRHSGRTGTYRYY